MRSKINKSTKADVVHAITKGGIGSIPVIGALASEIFGLIITPPLERRRLEWMSAVTARLKLLEQSGKVDLQTIQNNEEFIDVILQATTLVLKTSEKEKWRAFQNAVLNTAANVGPDQIKTQIFINQIDKFTALHINMLVFVDNPVDWFRKTNLNPPKLLMANIKRIIVDAFPDLYNQEELLVLVWNDLVNVSFVNTADISTTLTGNGALLSRTTSLGQQFLQYIDNDPTQE